MTLIKTGLSVLSLCSLLTLALFNLALSTGMIHRLSDPDYMDTVPLSWAIPSMALLGVLATLTSSVAAILQCRQSRPNLIMAAILSSLILAICMFSFLWTSISTPPFTEIATLETLSWVQSQFLNSLIIGSLWIGGCMIVPLTRACADRSSV